MVAGTREYMERRIRDLMDDLRRRMIVREFYVQDSVNTDAKVLGVRFHNGRVFRYTLTAMELLNGGQEGLDFWLRTVEQDILCRAEQLHAGYDHLTPCPSGNDPIAGQSEVGQDGHTRIFDGSCWRILQDSGGYISGWAGGLQYAAPDPKAVAKAADLFKMACGKEAFDILESGNPLPLKGSLGTAYTLHKRASYCVERDGTRLCAVVPGVPLWDHLLGIKLMIEHDEPKFLKIANVAHGGFPGYTQGTRALVAQFAAQNNSLLRPLQPPRSFLSVWRGRRGV